MMLKKIFSVIKVFYFQVYYRWYLLVPKDKLQAEKLGLMICWFSIFSNIYLFFSLLVFFGIVEHAGVEQNISFYIVSAILASIIYFPNNQKLEKHLYANLNNLKKQDKAYNLKWRIIAFLYPIVSFLLVSFLLSYLYSKSK